MKKKVALLLVLSLLLAVLPMNVFGARGRVVGILPQPQSTAFPFVARIDVADIASRTDSQLVDGEPDEFVMLRLTVSGQADNSNVAFSALTQSTTTGGAIRNNAIHVAPSTNLTLATGVPGDPPTHAAFSVELINPAAGAGTPGANPANSDVREIIVALRYHANWDFTTGSAIPAHVFGTLDLQFGMGGAQGGIVANNENARLRINIINRAEEIVLGLVDSPLTAVSANHGVVITAGASRNFNSALILPRIDLRERLPESLNRAAGDTAPTTSHMAIRLTGPLDYVWNVGIPGALAGVGDLDITEARGGILSAAVTNFGAIRAFDDGGRPVLELFVQIPDRSTGLAGQLIETLQLSNIMLVPTRNAPLTGEVRIDVAVGNRAGGDTGNWNNNRDSNNWRTTGLLVGERIGTSLEMTTSPAQDALPVLVSGRTSSIPATYANNDDHGNFRAATLNITELVPGAFDTGFLNSLVDFEFSEGVQLVHAAFRLDPGDVPWTPANRTDVQDPNNNALNFQGVSFMTPNFLRIFVPRNTNATELRRLQVSLYFHVEAGYEWKYDGQPITATVAGNAVTALTGDRTINVAEVRDRITLELDGEPTQVSVGNVFNIQSTQIPDIIISEVNVGDLTRGSTLTVSLLPRPIAVFGTHAITSTTVTVDPDSGMRISSVRTGANVVITIDRESNRPDTPAVITLSNNFIIGTVLPGIEYVVAVNAETSTDALSPNTWLGANANGMFDAMPYFVTVAEFGDFDQDALPPLGGGNDGPGPVERGSLEVTSAMTSMTMPLSGQTVQAPYRLVQGVGMVAVRAVAEVLLGVEPGWEQASGTVTITAHHADTGAAITVILTVGNNVAIVNGFPVDIATHGDFRSGPAGSVRPLNVDGRIMLPARFLGEVFGYHVEAVTSNGTVVGVSIR
jgi:hypothetical protein